jgi:hypothetical protein
MKKEKKPLQVTMETVRHLESDIPLRNVAGNDAHVTSTVNTWYTQVETTIYCSVGCCGCG